MGKYADSFYSIVLVETGDWSKTLIEAMKKFEKDNLNGRKQV